MNDQSLATCKAVASGPSLYLVIPKELREHLGIKEGDDFNVYYDKTIGIIYRKREGGLSK